MTPAAVSAPEALVNRAISAMETPHQKWLVSPRVTSILEEARRVREEEAGIKCEGDCRNYAEGKHAGEVKRFRYTSGPLESWIGTIEGMCETAVAENIRRGYKVEAVDA